MQRFFAEPHQIEEENGIIRILGSDVNHIRNVLRMKPGEEVWISDGDSREFHCCIQELEEETVILKILERGASDYELPNAIYLFQGIPKGDKMEMIIQKAVELGAYAVVPVEMKRCVVKLDAKKAEKKTARWQQIAESAAKQSKRMVIPKVYPVATYKDALSMARNLDICLVPYESAKGIKGAREIIGSLKPGQSIGVFIGPEGGFEEEEIKEATDRGGQVITLGKRILRTETAGLAALSILMFHLEGE